MVTPQLLGISTNRATAFQQAVACQRKSFAARLRFFLVQSFEAQFSLQMLSALQPVLRRSG